MAVRIRSARLAIAAALPLLALSACGGVSAPKVLSKAEFIHQADAICGPTTAKVNAIASPGDTATPADAVAYVQQTLPIIEPAVQRLAALPAALADYVVLDQNLIAPTRAQSAAARALIAGVQQAGGDSAAAQAALDQFTSAAADPDQVAHDKALSDFGFDACAKTTPPPPPATTTTLAPQPAFVARDAHFSAVFPVTPTRHAVSQSAVQAITYVAVVANEEDSVSFALIPVALPVAATRAALDAGIDRAAASLSGTVSSRQAITFLGSPAEDAVIESPGHIIHAREVIIGRSFYVLQGITPTADAPRPNYDRLVATFHTV